MKKTTRVILFAVVAVMLLSFAPFCAFADGMPADGVITVGNGAAATVPIDGYYTLKFTAPEDGEYVVWSEAGEYYDPIIVLYDAEGTYTERNDDASCESYYYNFKLTFEAEANDVFYFEISNYDEAVESTIPVFVDKLAEPTGIEVLNAFHPATTVVDWLEPVWFRLIPANSVGGDYIVVSDNPDVVYTDNGSLFYMSAGKANLTISLQNNPEVASSFEINVTEPYIPELALDEFAPLNGGAEEYKFVVPEDGDYVIYTTQPDVKLVINHSDQFNKMWMRSLQKGESYILGSHLLSMPMPGMFSEPCYIVVKKATESKDFDFAFYNKDDPETETEVIYPDQEIIVKAEISDPASTYNLSVEFSADDEKVDIIRQDEKVSNIKFSKPGTYTVTAVNYDERTVTKTVTVSECPEVTLDKPYVYTTEKEYTTGIYSPVIFPVAFTAPEDGVYTIEVGNDMGMTSALIPMGNGAPSTLQNVISGITMQKDEKIVFNVHTGMGIASDVMESLFKKGELNVTVTAKKYVELTDISVPESITLKGHQTKVLELTPVPADASIDFAGMEVDMTDGIRLGFSNGKFSIASYEGDGSVTFTFPGDIVKTIDVEVLPSKELELDTPVGAEEDVLLDSFTFTAPEDGRYTFSVKNALAEGYEPLCDGLGGFAEAFYSNTTCVFMEENQELTWELMPLGDDASLSVTKSVKATGMEVNGVITAVLGEYAGLSAMIPPVSFTPYNAIPEVITKVTFEDPSIATYFNGEIYGGKVGSTKIELESASGLKATATLVVIDRTPATPTDLYLNKTELALEEGESETLVATAESVLDDEFYWSSSDESVATVDQNGKVTAVGAGTATIYANYYFIPLKCTVTVTEKQLPIPTPKPDPDLPTKPEIKDTTKIFKDVEEGRWYNKAVDYTYSYGFIAGVAADKFGVDEEVTRGQFITILARIAGVDTTGDANKVTTKFKDVESGRYYTAAIKWANENGVVAGISDTEFAPNKAIERQQLCVMIVNFAKQQGVEIAAVEAALSFADEAAIGNYAKEAVAICQKADIVNGYNDQGKLYFKPVKTASRVEAAQILYKFHKDFVAK